MGKKKVKNSQDLSSLASNKSPVLELKFNEPLFALACHPEQALLFSGLSTGHILCHRYEPDALQKRMKKNEHAAAKAKEGEPAENKKFWTVVEAREDGSSNTEGFELVWKTKRHKGSVRSICLDADGTHIYSIGADCVLKKANSQTGKVVKKTQVSQDTGVKFTKIVKSATHPFLLLGDESGNVIVLNSETLELKNTIRGIHNGDAINDIFHFTGKSVHKFVSLGQTTLAYWDARESNEGDMQIPADDLDAKRKVRLSEDQEDEILCGTFLDPQDGETLICGMGEGILTIWKPKKNDLVDQISRIKVKKDESLDCMISTLQDDSCVWVGCSDGHLYRVNVKTSKVVEIRKHSGLDEVLFLDLDSEYRLVSGGMDKVKIWESSASDDDDREQQAEIDSDSSASEMGSDDSSSNSELESGSDVELEEDPEGSGSDEDSDESTFEEGELVGLSKEELLEELDKDLCGSDQEEGSKPSRKRTAADGGDNGASKKSKAKQKPKQKQLTSKQLRNLQKHEHGIKRFEDL